jgi:DNA-directed RNA polymerase subunit M/transcription elongation factor TFIIS
MDIVKDIDSFILKYDASIDAQKRSKAISDKYFKLYRRAPTKAEMDKEMKISKQDGSPKFNRPMPDPEDNPNYEYGNGGEVQLKPEHQIDAAEHIIGDRKSNKIKKEEERRARLERHPLWEIAGQIAGGAVGIGLGEAVGGPIGAAIGALAGEHIGEGISEYIRSRIHKQYSEICKSMYGTDENLTKEQMDIALDKAIIEISTDPDVIMKMDFYKQGGEDHGDNPRFGGITSKVDYNKYHREQSAEEHNRVKVGKHHSIDAEDAKIMASDKDNWTVKKARNPMNFKKPKNAGPYWAPKGYVSRTEIMERYEANPQDAPDMDEYVPIDEDIASLNKSDDWYAEKLEHAKAILANSDIPNPPTAESLASAHSLSELKAARSKIVKSNDNPNIKGVAWDALTPEQKAQLKATRPELFIKKSDDECENCVGSRACEIDPHRTCNNRKLPIAPTVGDVLNKKPVKKGDTDSSKWFPTSLCPKCGSLMTADQEKCGKCGEKNKKVKKEWDNRASNAKREKHYDKVRHQAIHEEGKKLNKSKDHTEVEIANKPNCDLCGKPALYDGKTTDGPWGYMCQNCFNEHGSGLGLGKGQKLIHKELISKIDDFIAKTELKPLKPWWEKGKYKTMKYPIRGAGDESEMMDAMAANYEASQKVKKQREGQTKCDRCGERLGDEPLAEVTDKNGKNLIIHADCKTDSDNIS